MHVVVFSAGAWASILRLEDPDLQNLAARLPLTVLQCRADSTTKKYLYAYAFRRWDEWAHSKTEITPFPAKPIHVALYLQHLADTSKSKASVTEAANAIAWAHRMAGIHPPTKNALVQVVINALDRKLAQPKIPKEPLIPSMLAHLVSRFGTPTATLSHVRSLAAFLLAYSAFLHLMSCPSSDVVTLL